MARRFKTFLMCAAVLAVLSGCTAFDKEYFSATTYVDVNSEYEEPENGVVMVGNYSGLRAALSRMVAAHEETAVLNLRKYEGDITNDMAAASKEVSSNTALGDYSVDFISYDINRIVAYYEASIYISYTRTAEETWAVKQLKNMSELASVAAGALENMESSFAVSLNSRSVDEEEIRGKVWSAVHENPLYTVYKPEVSVEMFTGNGVQKIFEVTFKYDDEAEDQAEKREALLSAVKLVAGEVTAETDAYKAYQAAGLLVASVTSDEAAGSTAYDALVQSTADSEGMAMAFCAVLQELEIPCRAVTGRLGTEEHYWNLFQVDGEWYHADLSRAAADSFAATFLVTDSYMWGNYWWDTDSYPVCDGSLSYSTLTSK